MLVDFSTIEQNTKMKANEETTILHTQPELVVVSWKTEVGTNHLKSSLHINSSTDPIGGIEFHISPPTWVYKFLLVNCIRARMRLNPHPS